MGQGRGIEVGREAADTGAPSTDSHSLQDAIKSTKAAPAQSGILVDGNSGGNSVANGYRKPSYAYVSSTTTTTTTPAPAPSPAPYEEPSLAQVDIDSGVGKLNYLSPEQAAKLEPPTQLGFDHYPDELPRARDQLLHGQVQIQPNGEPHEDSAINAINVYDEEADHGFAPGRFASVIASTTPRPPLAVYAAAPDAGLATPSLSMLPPLGAPSQRRRLRPRPTAIGIVATTPSPIAVQETYGYSTPAPFAPPPSITNPGYHYSPAATPAHNGYGYYTPNSPLEVNALDAPLLPPLPDRAYRRRLRPLHNNQLDASNGVADYDGVSVTRNGFRYVLPKQYHEEAQVDDKRAGSFGYVDPFGIRRVVYYNASPGRGFVHRNNNQFVGANGAPYDDPGPAQLVNE